MNLCPTYTDLLAKANMSERCESTQYVWRARIWETGAGLPDLPKMRTMLASTRIVRKDDNTSVRDTLFLEKNGTYSIDRFVMTGTKVTNRSTRPYSTHDIAYACFERLLRFGLNASNDLYKYSWVVESVQSA